MKFCIHQHGRLCRVPIVQIVRSVLEVPAELAAERIERQHRIGVQIVAFALVAVIVRAWIAGSPEKLVGLGIISTREPCGSAAMLDRLAGPSFRQRLTRRGNCPETPDALAGRYLISGDEAAHSLIAA